MQWNPRSQFQRMLDVNFLPAMPKMTSTVVFAPARTHSHSHQGTRVRAPWQECTKREFPKVGGNSHGNVPGGRKSDEDSPKIGAALENFKTTLFH